SSLNRRIINTTTILHQKHSNHSKRLKCCVHLLRPPSFSAIDGNQANGCTEPLTDLIQCQQGAWFMGQEDVVIVSQRSIYDFGPESQICQKGGIQISTSIWMAPEHLQYLAAY
ncbi:MAG: hypothetical protein ACR2O3_18230, partial [Rhizobiaceae bacterium]